MFITFSWFVRFVLTAAITAAGDRRIRATQISLRCTSALIFVRCRRAQRHIPRSGAMIVCPGCVNEYSTARRFEMVALLAINPEDSRLRRVLVRIRCETPWRRRRNSP
jgi:hypothetical protein